MNQPKAPAGRPGRAGGAGQAGPALTLLDPPPSIVTAVRLMYAGAALTAIGIIVDALNILIGHSVRHSHPHASAARIHATQNSLLVGLAFEAVIEIGAWVFVARANRSGLKWARIVAAVLFAIYSASLIFTLFSASTIAEISFSSLIWLAGLGATVFLWRRESTGYFDAPAASRPA